MYFSQILPQQQTLAPVTTSFIQMQPQQSFSYIQVPQTQQLGYMTPQLVQPVPMAMPGQLYQCPTYDRFIHLLQYQEVLHLKFTNFINMFQLSSNKILGQFLLFNLWHQLIKLCQFLSFQV